MAIAHFGGLERISCNPGEMMAFCSKLATHAIEVKGQSTSTFARMQVLKKCLVLSHCVSFSYGSAELWDVE